MKITKEDLKELNDKAHFNKIERAKSSIIINEQIKQLKQLWNMEFRA